MQTLVEHRAGLLEGQVWECWLQEGPHSPSLSSITDAAPAFGQHPRITQHLRSELPKDWHQNQTCTFISKSGQLLCPRVPETFLVANGLIITNRELFGPWPLLALGEGLWNAFNDCVAFQPWKPGLPLSQLPHL